MDVFAIKPRKELQPYIDRYWGWESENAVRLPLVLPGTGAELIFQNDVPFTVKLGDSLTYETAQSHLLCVRSYPFHLQVRGRFGFIAVRFKAGGFRHFCSVPMHDLGDNIYTTGDLWGRAGKDLEDRLAYMPSRLEKIRYLESYLLDCLSQYVQGKSHIDIALQRLYDNHASIKIQQLAKQLRISRRHFERTFKAEIGVSPKLFQRLSQFQHTIRELLLTRTTHYIQIALAHGYYDQSHFIDSFKSFTQMAPTTFLVQENFLSHFYNPKWQCSPNI